MTFLTCPPSIAFLFGFRLATYTLQGRYAGAAEADCRTGY